jgi:hypothetical protein
MPNRNALLLVFALIGACGGGSSSQPPDAPPVGGDGPPRDTSASCNEALVEPRGGAGPFMLGALCDDVVACVADEVEAARVSEVAPHFECEPSGFGCPALACSYRNPGGPGTIDAEEYAEICALTLLAPPPALACFVYL